MDRRTFLGQAFYLSAQLLFAWNAGILFSQSFADFHAVFAYAIYIVVGMLSAALVNVAAFLMYRSFPKWKED
jgi:Na+/H+ antiporter NhaD/arsenite permease-like protein